ncbi:hypothetical protein [Streptomyces sp. NPDC005302]|uniref:hypothetical protein n=1 Tax=Streptomyces sp. NPDC005302 TaxID=3154675 RepID=UPI0033BB6484
MDTLTPTEPTPTDPDTAPAPPAPAPAGPPCGLCGDSALVHWMRRPTDEEYAHYKALEQDRYNQTLLLADPQLPKPVQTPLIPAAEMTVAVYACGPHAITLEDAALIHSSACTAPNETDLPGHDCVAERLPAEPPEEPGPLPAHWTSGGQ